MPSDQLPSVVRPKVVGATVLLTLMVVLVAPKLVKADDQTIAEGKRIWAERAQCVECHGWAGNGERTSLHSAGQAPSLRLTQLSRDEIRMTIQCGRPGTPMPYFDRFAYTDKRCYGMTAEEVGDNMPDRGQMTLQSYEIDAVADYVAAKIKGAGPVTRSQCEDFFRPNIPTLCQEYPEK